MLEDGLDESGELVDAMIALYDNSYLGTALPSR